MLSIWHLGLKLSGKVRCDAEITTRFIRSHDLLVPDPTSRRDSLRNFNNLGSVAEFVGDFWVGGVQIG